jgi:hypothetical protein
MLLHDALEALELGRADAIVFQRQDANTFDMRSASVIIRVLKTPAGTQYARHELDGMGRTGSGFYGKTTDEILSFHYKVEGKRNTKHSFAAMMRARDVSTKHWCAVNDDQLPENLVWRPAPLHVDTNVESYLGV